jgi:hypothetical protein
MLCRTKLAYGQFLGGQARAIGLRSLDFRQHT